MHNSLHRPSQKQEISSFYVSESDSCMAESTAFNPTKAETALWSAVITQALMDAGSESRKPEARHEKAKAIRWLLGNSEDFITVCQNAGLDPLYVREKAKTAIERGCVWRRGMEDKRNHRHATSKECHAVQPVIEHKYYIPAPPTNQPKPPRLLTTLPPLHKRAASFRAPRSSFAAFPPHRLYGASHLSGNH